MNIHVNHPNEISAELALATDKLTRAGSHWATRRLLLAGVNDCVNIQRDLVHQLVRIRVRPYYLYQCDLVKGSGHFAHRLPRALRSWKACAGIPAVTRFPRMLWMLRAAAARYR
jgi:L-lysine 2,3-aminomutase